MAKKQDSPHQCVSPSYGAQTQKPIPDDNGELLCSAKIHRIQQIVGSLLYYARVVDSTLLVTLGSIAQQQLKATKTTELAVNQLLDYCYYHPTAKLRFYASDMILKAFSDASYLSEPNAKIRVGGYFYLGKAPVITMDDNGAMHITAIILKHVVTSASEAEYAALFYNAKQAIPLRIALREMGHQQPLTPMCTDNITASGIANQTNKPKMSKSMDMRFHWLQDQSAQNNFNCFGDQELKTKQIM